FLGVRKNFPQPRRHVPRRGDDALSIGAERRASHETPMCERLADLLAGLALPQPRRAVQRRSGDDALAVGAERRRPLIPPPRARFAVLLAGLDIPQPRRLVP